jgi:putative FmdB family regulatory protein
MPTYEYECSKCGHVTEVFQSITAKPLRKLPEPCEGCGERVSVTRLLGTGGAVIFKGSGFYETDYRSESYKKAAEAAKGEKKSDSAKDTKADSSKSSSDSSTKKPAASGDSKPSGSKGKSSAGKNAA